MFPIRDNIPSRSTPYVNYGVIVVCALVFLLQIATPEDENRMVERFGMIPKRISQPTAEIEVPYAVQEVRTPRGIQYETVTRPAAPVAVPVLLTMLTCVFLHGGWMHLLGNMWFLHIFGDNIEDRFGHLGYALFYLASGVGASLVHYWSDPASSVPTIGASGAIAGVMGAYLVWYPHSRVEALVPLFVFVTVMIVPAPLFLGIWFLLQTFSVFGAAQGVAWWAHIGGFVFGAVMALMLGKTPLIRPPNTRRRFDDNRIRMYRRPIRRQY